MAFNHVYCSRADIDRTLCKPLSSRRWVRLLVKTKSIPSKICVLKFLTHLHKNPQIPAADESADNGEALTDDSEKSHSLIAPFMHSYHIKIAPGARLNELYFDRGRDEMDAQLKRVLKRNVNGKKKVHDLKALSDIPSGRVKVRAANDTGSAVNNVTFYNFTNIHFG